jgi:hypothetical protein
MWQTIKSWFSCGKKEKEVERRASLSDMSKSDQKDLVSGVFFSIIEGVRITMATLLSIFVPQYCEDTNTTCTLEQNFSNLSRFNEFVIFFNFLSLAIFVKLIYTINKREAYLISHLEESRDHPYNGFSDNLKAYPRIVIRVKEHNQLLKKWTNYTLFSYTLNVIFSCVLIFNYYYDGFRSVSTMLANLLLVSGKLHSLYTIYNDCIENNEKPLALSTSKITQVSFNVIDPVYVKRKSVVTVKSEECKVIVEMMSEDKKEENKKQEENNTV